MEAQTDVDTGWINYSKQLFNYLLFNFWFLHMSQKYN